MLREVTSEFGGALSDPRVRGCSECPQCSGRSCGRSQGTHSRVWEHRDNPALRCPARPAGISPRCAGSGALGTRSSASCRVPLLGNSPETLRCPGEATLLKLSIVCLFADQAMGSGQLSAARISAPEVLRWSQTPVTVTRHPNRGWSYFCSCFLHCSIRRAWGNCPAPVVSAAVREKIKTFSAQEDLSLPLLKTEFI